MEVRGQRRAPGLRAITDGRPAWGPPFATVRRGPGMTHIQMTTHVDAPIDPVFALGTDYERFPDWNVSYS